MTCHIMPTYSMERERERKLFYAFHFGLYSFNVFTMLQRCHTFDMHQKLNWQKWMKKNKDTEWIQKNNKMSNEIIDLKMTPILSSSNCVGTQIMTHTNKIRTKMKWTRFMFGLEEKEESSTFHILLFGSFQMLAENWTPFFSERLYNNWTWFAKKKVFLHNFCIQFRYISMYKSQLSFAWRTEPAEIWLHQHSWLHNQLSLSETKQNWWNAHQLTIVHY